MHVMSCSSRERYLWCPTADESTVSRKRYAPSDCQECSTLSYEHARYMEENYKGILQYLLGQLVENVHVRNRHTKYESRSTDTWRDMVYMHIAPFQF